MNLGKSKKQIILLYSSTIIGVFIGVLVSILNTRYMDPSSYGDVRYVNNIIAFFSGIFLFGYFVSGSRLLALSKTKEETNQIKGGLVFILGITVCLMIFVMIISGIVHNYYLHKNYYYLFYLVIPVCGSTLLLNYINTSSQGDNSITTIALARLLPQSLYLIVASIIYKFYGATSEIMLLIQNGISLVILSFLILKSSPDFSNIKKSLKKLYEENKIYGLQVYYGSLANVSVQYIAGLSLGLLGKDNTEVGFYTLALTVTSPLMMLPNVIGTTYFKKFANQNIIPKNVLYCTYIMSIISLIGFVFLIHPLVNLLYDDSYSNIAAYASFLALGFTLHGLGDVYNRFLGAHGKGLFLRNAAWISGIISIIGYTLGIYYWGIFAAIVTRIVTSLTYFITLLYYYLKFIK